MQFRSLLRIAAPLALAAALTSPAFATDSKTMEASGPAAKAGVYVDDAAITAKVKAALLSEKTISALDVKVSTKEGVVTLSGKVDKPEAGVRALQVASAVEGVKSVQSELQVGTN